MKEYTTIEVIQKLQENKNLRFTGHDYNKHPVEIYYNEGIVWNN